MVSETVTFIYKHQCRCNGFSIIDPDSKQRILDYYQRAEVRYFLEELLFILEPSTSSKVVSSYFWQRKDYSHDLATEMGLSDITLTISSERSALKLL
ncbi:hypothetical protein H2O73_00535 [Vibrio sp. 404]|uniref:Uncharacterized protein n=1 Tax=Vibrio marinisediminis TaxID=2758441 RepID=A0A7W2FMH0_9VIBR|nr:hypothetical protein [Vibrio marinisediminis]MBA5760815.1 hypothetical protein [Vibrio marinisediminis]